LDDPFTDVQHAEDAAGIRVPDAAAPPRQYTAQEGDSTPLRIAKRFDAHTRPRWQSELAEANPTRDWSQRIFPNEVITIPDAWPAPFWGAAWQRGFLDASGPNDPFSDFGEASGPESVAWPS